ncbi:MAG: hypothetical protein GX303_07730 [Clostridiales bacterium]|nr:hypothetical protein [Clostridiales bacterium]
MDTTDKNVADNRVIAKGETDTAKQERRKRLTAADPCNSIKIIYCNEGPALAKIVTESFLIYLKSREAEDCED